MFKISEKHKTIIVSALVGVIVGTGGVLVYKGEINATEYKEGAKMVAEACLHIRDLETNNEVDENSTGDDMNN